MPRPQKKRLVCCMPKSGLCLPENPDEAQSVFMTVDEYETIRLIDLEKNTQEECAAQMHISRTTVQGIYDSARTKIADSIVNSKKMIISGGDYVVCKCYGKQCGRGCKQLCHKHPCYQNDEEKT